MNRKIIKRITFRSQKLALMEGGGKFAVRLRHVSGNLFHYGKAPPLNLVTEAMTEDFDTPQAAIAAAKAGCEGMAPAHNSKDWTGTPLSKKEQRAMVNRMKRFVLPQTLYPFAVSVGILGLVVLLYWLGIF